MEPETLAPADSADWWRNELKIIVRERVGMNEEFAALFADSLFAGLRERAGGREVYIPAPDKTSRDQQIRAMFNGRNLAQVMREFGVSRRTVYNVCK